MNILIIEQDKDICQTLTDILKDSGSNVDIACTEETARSFLKQKHCLTILDHYTFKVFHLTLKDIENQNILIISTFYKDIEKTFKTDKIKCLKKPFDIDDLMSFCK